MPGTQASGMSNAMCLLAPARASCACAALLSALAGANWPKADRKACCSACPHARVALQQPRFMARRWMTGTECCSGTQRQSCCPNLVERVLCGLAQQAVLSGCWAATGWQSTLVLKIAALDVQGM
jgi:hypothetical protein